MALLLPVAPPHLASSNAPFLKPKKKKRTLRSNRNLLIMASIKRCNDVYNRMPSGTFKKGRRQIPLEGVRLVDGYQVLSLRMYSAALSVSSSAGSIISTTFQFTFANFTDYSSVTLLFDEYRPVRARIYYNSAFAGSNVNSGILVGAIDYDDTTALSSYTAALSYDTHKIFCAAGAGNPNVTQTSWDIPFDGGPDTDWLTTASASVAFATFKLYGDSSFGTGISATYGMLHADCDFQFRQAD